jgi:hypothetical protein
MLAVTARLAREHDGVFMRLVMPRTVRSEDRPFIRHSPDLSTAPGEATPAL